MIHLTELSDLLSKRSLEVCRLLFPEGTVQSGEYCVGDIHGNPGKSLKVQLEGSHAGHWRDWSDAEYRGDLLDLWRYASGIPAGDAIKQAKEFLGIVEPRALTVKKYSKAPEKKLPPPEPRSTSLAWLQDVRKISKEIIDLFKIVVAPSEKAIVFESWSPSGEIVNRSYRTLDEKKKVWQDKGCAPSLFGWHAVSDDAYGTRTIVLSEGQIDAMTWKQWGFDCLSIPNGTGMTWIEYEWDNLAAFERIYLAFDMDEEGRNITREVSHRLGPERCLIVEMPHKDANDCLVKHGCTEKDALKWIKAAKHPRFDGVVTAGELAARIIDRMKPKPKPFTHPLFDRDWKFQKGLYFRKGEVTGWTGTPGSGKSTLLNTVVLHSLIMGLPAMICSPEMPVEETVERIVRSLLAMGGKPKTEYEIHRSLEDINESLVLIDKIGFIAEKQLLDYMTFCYRRYNVQVFVIDSMMRVENLEEDYPAQGRFLNVLQEFAKEKQVHVHLVCHPSKSKDARVRGADMKGSSAIYANVDNSVVVVRNPEKLALLQEGRDLTDEENELHDTEVIVDKQRSSGWMGAFYLKFNPYDLTFTETTRKTIQKPEPKSNSWGNKYRKPNY